MKHILSVIVLAFLLTAVGCNRNAQLPVSGAVTLDGSPLSGGSISFQPADPSASRGSGATIRDGRYAIPAAQGLVPGKYLVTIEASRLTGRMVPGADGTGQVPEVGRATFAEKMPLEATVDAAHRTLDFYLTSVR
jgi:hypothetical protein